jgi:UDP-glucose 4-epimerase
MRSESRSQPSPLRIVITGSSGFIGSWLLEHLVRRGHAVVGMDRVPRAGPARAEAFLQGEVLDLTGERLRALRPDVLVHLAEPASVGKSFESAYEECRNGLLGTSHVLDLWRDLPGVRLVYVSSAAVYGDRAVRCCAESLACRPMSPYGAFKAAAENLIRIVGGRAGQSYLIVRPFSVYGPGLRKQVIYDVANRMLDAPGRHLEITGTGEEERDFVYVEDCCGAVAALVERPPRERGCVVNVGTGRRVTLRALIGLLRDYTGTAVSFAFSGKDAPGNPRWLVADVRRLRRLGVSCPTPVEEGLRRTVEAIAASRQPLAAAHG